MRIAGAAGVLACVVAFAEFRLWFVGESMPPFWEATAFSEFVARHATLYLTRTLMDLVIFGFMFVFFGGFRHLMVLTRESSEWLATTFFGIAMVYIAVTLVADSLAATVALDTSGGRADPTVVRALNESTVLLFGSVGASLVVAMTTVAGVLIVTTAALPRWVAVLAWGAALCNLAFVPTLYFGTDFRKFYSAAGDGPAATGPFVFTLWIFATSISMMRTPGHLRRSRTSSQSGDPA